MFDLTTYVKKWRIRQLKTVFSTLDTLWGGEVRRLLANAILNFHFDYLNPSLTMKFNCHFSLVFDK